MDGRRMSQALPVILLPSAPFVNPRNQPQRPLWLPLSCRAVSCYELGAHSGQGEAGGPLGLPRRAKLAIPCLPSLILV